MPERCCVRRAAVLGRSDERIIPGALVQKKHPRKSVFCAKLVLELLSNRLLLRLKTAARC
jgi:hypothetical protein